MISEATILTILQVFGGGLFGFLVARYTINKQQAQRIIFFKTSQIRLLRLHDKTPDSIKVTVDKSAITDNPEDVGQDVQVKSAVAHSVVVKNKGNSAASDIYLEIEFEGESKIISFGSSITESEHYRLRMRKSQHSDNKLEVHIPYLNKDQELVLSVVLASDGPMKAPKIVGIGKEIEVKEFNAAASPWPGMAIAALFILLVFSVASMFESEIVQGTAASMLPESVILFLGGSIQTMEVRVLLFPLLHKAAVLGGLAALIVLMIYRAVSKRRF